jgi:hypothetical protein
MAASLTSTDLTLDNTSGASIPGTPSAGQTVIYPKDDKLLYYKDDAGVERRVDAGLGYMLVRDEKAVGTAGGTNIGGVNTRVLNTVLRNTIVGASLASNEVTLPAGTYLINGSASTRQVNAHKCYLYNITAAALAIAGTSELSPSAVASVNSSFVKGSVTVSATTVFSLRHHTDTANATEGLGRAVNNTAAGVEVYAMLEIIKVD